MMASWEEDARNFLLGQEVEDDELFFILLAVVMLFLEEEETPEHTSSVTGAKKVKEILEGHENWCKEEFRMEAEIFRTSSSCSSCSSCSTCSSRSASDVGTNPFASFDGLYVSSAHNEADNEAQSARKQSHIGSAIEDYVESKKRQTSKTMEALNEKKRQDEEFSVQKCLDEVDSMVGLTTDEKSYALDIFKTEINRELFMKTKNQNVRSIWLKRQIRGLDGSNVSFEKKSAAAVPM